MGATRRLDHYDASLGWQGLFIIAGCGFVIIACGACIQIVQIIVSIRDRKKNLDTTGDPWNGRTFEWATSSPPPVYNFAVIPKVESRDAFWEMKKLTTYNLQLRTYQDIVMPKNTAMGIYISGFVFLVGFAIVWQIIWLIVVGMVGAILCVIIRSFDEETEYVISADTVARIEREKIPYYG